MRIIGGIYRSRIISMPKGVDIRPTQDKVRQAVFNILGDVNGMKVLDLFAGSGAFGLEAISRGAMGATFVEIEYACIKAIEANIGSLGISDGAYSIIRHDAEKALELILNQTEAYNLVFMDPPYGKGLAKNCLIMLDKYDILSQNALIVVESSKKDLLPAGLDTLRIIRQRRYGDTLITILRKTS